MGEEFDAAAQEAQADNLNTGEAETGEAEETGATDTGSVATEETETQKQGGTDKDQPPTRSEINRFYAEKRIFNKQKQTDSEPSYSPEQTELVKAMREELSPIFSQYQEQKDKSEFDKFFAENPGYDQYKDKTWKWWQHESRRGLPVSTVFYEVAGPDLKKLGATEKELADQAANEFKPTGQPSSGSSFRKDPMKMSNDEFDNEVRRIMTQS